MSGLRRHAASLVLVGSLVAAGPALAVTVTIPVTTYANTTAYTPSGATTPVTIIGHGASGTQAVPGWSWNYTGNFGDARYPAYMSYSNSAYLCIGPSTGIGTTHDCDTDDNLPPAGVDYPGYEFYYFAFVLPAGAQSPRANFVSLGGDDRAVVSLNGQELGNFASPASQQPHLGPSGVVIKDFALLAQDLWIASPTQFVTGTNVFRVWVNNTGSGGFGSAVSHSGGGGPSGTVIRGFVTYEMSEQVASPIPTLSEWALIALVALTGVFGALASRTRNVR
jgi:hypothetical protein